MTTTPRDIASHDSQARRRRGARSPSLTRSQTNSRASPILATTTSKRSPSPIITFHPTPLSADNSKGVKNITRKVIKRLEGLGHLEMVDMDMSVPEEDEQLNIDGEGREVEKVLYALGKEAVTNARASSTMNGNGYAHSKPAKKPKPDLEIPRKVLHASIGSFSLFIIVSAAYLVYLAKVFSRYTYTYRKATSRQLFSSFGWPWPLSSPPISYASDSKASLGRTKGYLGSWCAKASGCVIPNYHILHDSSSIQDSVNGVVWYILGVNFVLSLYPQDVATVAILM